MYIEQTLLYHLHRIGVQFELGKMSFQLNMLFNKRGKYDFASNNKKMYKWISQLAPLHSGLQDCGAEQGKVFSDGYL
jgi:hypothetical protein